MNKSIQTTHLPPLTKADLEQAKSDSPMVKNYSEALESQGIGFDVVQIVTTDESDDSKE